MTLIAYLTRIHFADLVLEEALPAELARLGIARPLILSDLAPARAPLLARLQEALPRCRGAPAHLLSAGQPRESALAAAAAAHARAGADGLVAFGGAAAMQLARALALALSHPRPLRAYGAGYPLPRPCTPVLAIPTEAGACAEALGALRLRARDGAALTLSSQNLIPPALICDPTLTRDLDPQQTAADGWQALSLCLESLLATGYNPPADGIALEGVRRGLAHLPAAVADGADPLARREVMAAALNAALAGQKGRGGVRALSCALRLGSVGRPPARSLHRATRTRPHAAKPVPCASGLRVETRAGAPAAARSGIFPAGAFGPAPSAPGPAAASARFRASAEARPSDGLALAAPTPRGPEAEAEAAQRPAAPTPVAAVSCGFAAAVLLPLLLRFNAPACAPRQQELARLLGLAGGRSGKAPSSDALAEGFERLRTRLALPVRLASLGVSPHALERIAMLAEADPASRTNPRRLDVADYLHLLRAAL